jgi:tetratricopeptide (TPR) repeat protein
MRNHHLLLLALLGSLVLSQPGAAQTAPSATKPEIVSLLGVKHYAQADEKGEIATAEQKLATDPKNIALLIALGRAQANAWQYQAAIATYSRGLKLAPDNAMLYRHRGHRFISTRRFDNALVDLAKASRLKSDDFDIWYHLGLAFYLKGQFDRAAQAYEKCRAAAEKAGKDDSIIAVSDWLYMTYRRLGQTDEAAKVLERITPQMKVEENKSYFDRLLFYKGLKKEEELINIEKATDLEIATVGYGLGNWHLYNGDKAKAEMYFQRVVKGKYWPAFGFIAAEAELARGKR